ncbi:MAG: hypothetical protein ACLU4P_08070 [Ruminococcus sp.]
MRGKTGKSVSGAYSQLRKGEKPVYDIIRVRLVVDGRDDVCLEINRVVRMTTAPVLEYAIYV